MIPVVIHFVSDVDERRRQYRSVLINFDDAGFFREQDAPIGQEGGIGWIVQARDYDVQSESVGHGNARDGRWCYGLWSRCY